MAEIIKRPVKIITGPCQTSSRKHVDFGLRLASMTVTNPDGRVVRPIAGLRHNFVKSRTALATGREGMGTAYPEWEGLSVELINALLSGGRMPKIPITEGARWAEEIQGKVPDMILAMETMDWVHSALFVGHILPRLGFTWLPSVMQLGPPASMIAKIAGDNQWAFGAKNAKWSEKNLPRPITDMEPSSLEKTAVGILGLYALLVAGMENPPPEVVHVERGVITTNMDDHRNMPDDQSARIVKMVMRDILKDIPEGKRPKLTIAKDTSHSDGPKRRDNIVEDSVIAATETLDFDGEPLYDMLIIESTEKGDKPLSDAGQHITGEEVQEMVDQIARKRVIFDRKDNLPKQK